MNNNIFPIVCIGEEVYELEDYLGKNYIEIETLLETKYGLVVTIEKKEPTDNSKDYNEQEIIIRKKKEVIMESLIKFFPLLPAEKDTTKLILAIALYVFVPTPVCVLIASVLCLTLSKQGKEFGILISIAVSMPVVPL